MVQVSSLESANYMFSGALRFDSNLAGWQVQKLTDLSYMFSGASKFNQDLCPWLAIIQPSAQFTSFVAGTACESTSDPISVISGPACTEVCSAP
jgi:hypothetical protein